MLSKRRVTELVLYSPAHIARLEAAGLFPERVKLGNNRVGWVESEVLDWLQAKVDARDLSTDTPQLEREPVMPPAPLVWKEGYCH